MGKQLAGLEIKVCSTGFPRRTVMGRQASLCVFRAFKAEDAKRRGFLYTSQGQEMNMKREGGKIKTHPSKKKSLGYG
jgi:hypothetical protein